MNPHIEKLLSVCKEATGGEWETSGDPGHGYVEIDALDMTSMGCSNDYSFHFGIKDARHITTFQPRNVEKLLVAVNNLLDICDSAASETFALDDYADNLKEALEQLSKEVE